MRDVSHIILNTRSIGENIASISQDIGLLLGSDGGDDANIFTRVKHSKGLVESILSILTMLSSLDFNTLDRHEELANEVRKIEFSCIGLQSILSQSLINPAVFKDHHFEIRSFLQSISMAANKIVTISLVTSCHTYNLESTDSLERTESSSVGCENIDDCCYEDNNRQNECCSQDISADDNNNLYNDKDVCYKDKAACEQDCDGICLQDKSGGLDVSSCPDFSETLTESMYIHVESGYHEEEHAMEYDGSSDVSMDGSINNTTDNTQNIEEVSEVKDFEIVPSVTSNLNYIKEQENITNEQDFVEIETNFIQSNSYNRIDDVVNLNTLNEYTDNLYDGKSVLVDSSSTDYTTQSTNEMSSEGFNIIEQSESSTTETKIEPEESEDVKGDSNISIDPIMDQELPIEGSDITADDEGMTTLETPITESVENTYETPTTVSYYDTYTSYDTTTDGYEITTENIETTTEYYYETTTECTTTAYETTTEDLYKVSQDIYSAAQDLSTKANEISSITSDISSKISSINSMVSDLNNYEDDELSKKIQAVSKITQEISSKTSEISSLCSTISSLASDISSASSDMTSADRHHRFRTSPWQKMSSKCQDMVTSCQSIVTTAQDILLSLDGLVSQTETLKVAVAVSTGVYDVTAKTQLVISETLNIVSAVIELMNVIES